MNNIGKISGVFLGLGSNLDDSRRNIQIAADLLARTEFLEIKQLSPLYSTPPMGPQNQADFVNAVAEIQTTLDPQDLLIVCKSIEAQMGRVISERWGPRVIDIDILVYDDQIFRAENLQIPHTGISQRSFVLYPLADLAPELDIPGLPSLAELIKALGAAEIHQI